MSNYREAISDSLMREVSNITLLPSSVHYRDIIVDYLSAWTRGRTPSSIPAAGITQL